MSRPDSFRGNLSGRYLPVAPLLSTSIALLVAMLAMASPALAAPAPSIESASVSSITQHGATLEAKINPEGSETGYEIWFWHGCSGGACERGPPYVVAQAADIGDGNEGLVVNANLTELEPGQSNNEFWVVASNGIGTSESAHQQFATPPHPRIEGESVSHVSASDATLEAVINPEGLPQGADYQFQVVKNSNEYPSELVCAQGGVVQPVGHHVCLAPPDWPTGTIPLRWVSGGDEGKPVSLDLASVGVTLQPGTTYHYRVLAALSGNGLDTVAWEPPAVIGADQTFTTPPAHMPSVESESVSHITATDATLEAQIDTEGLETTYQFRLESGCLPPAACLVLIEYPLPKGQLLGSFVGQNVSLDLNSAGVTLRPDTRYRYSVDATNSVATTRDSDQIFTTPSETLLTNQISGSDGQPPAIHLRSSPLPPHNRKHRHHRRHRRGLHPRKQHRANRSG